VIFRSQLLEQHLVRWTEYFGRPTVLIANQPGISRRRKNNRGVFAQPSDSPFRAGPSRHGWLVALVRTAPLSGENKTCFSNRLGMEREFRNLLDFTCPLHYCPPAHRRSPARSSASSASANTPQVSQPLRRAFTFRGKTSCYRRHRLHGKVGLVESCWKK